MICRQKKRRWWKRKILENNNAVKTNKNYFSNLQIKKINQILVQNDGRTAWFCFSRSKIANNILRFLHKFSTTLAFVKVAADFILPDFLFSAVSLSPS